MRVFVFALYLIHYLGLYFIIYTNFSAPFVQAIIATFYIYTFVIITVYLGSVINSERKSAQFILSTHLLMARNALLQKGMYFSKSLLLFKLALKNRDYVDSIISYYTLMYSMKYRCMSLLSLPKKARYWHFWRSPIHWLHRDRDRFHPGTTHIIYDKACKIIMLSWSCIGWNLVSISTQFE